MSKLSHPYRRSIWDHDSRYDHPTAGFSKSEAQTISRLMAVDAAKKRTPPIPPSMLLDIAAQAKQMPPAKSTTAKNVEQYLHTCIKHYGAGIATLVCMLAVESKGDYPPMDRKFAAGLQAENKVSEAEFEALLSSNITAFAQTYVAKVIPAWTQSRASPRTAKEADDYWGGKA